MTEEAQKPEISFQEKIVIHQKELMMKLESVLLQTKPYILYRWISFIVLLAIFLLRMILQQRFYAIGYVLGLYLVNCVILFLSPKLDPEIYGTDVLPTAGDNDYKPFVRKLPEFVFWSRISKALVLAHLATLIPLFDPPVYAPILLVYFIIVFIVSFHSRIMHMIRNHYVPFTIGKPKSKKEADK